MATERIRHGVGLDIENNDIKDLLLYGVTGANVATYLATTDRKIVYDTTNKVIKYYNGTTIKTLATLEDLPSGSLAGLSDTEITTPADAHLLIYDSTAPAKWKNKALSGHATITNAGALTIANDAINSDRLASRSVTFTKALQTINDERILGRVSAGAGNVEELTVTQARTLLNIVNYSHPTGFSSQPASALTGAAVISQITVNTEGHVTGITSRNLTPANIGAEPTLTKGDLTAAGAIVVNVTRQIIGGGAEISHVIGSGFNHLPVNGASNQFVVYGGAAGVGSWASMSDTLHGTRSGGTQHSAATTSVAGFMSSADKTKLDGIAANANNYSHPNHSGDVTSVSDGATTVAMLQGNTLTMANATKYTFSITLQNATTVTFPTSGTLATLGNAETFSGAKTFSGNTILNGDVSGTRLITSSGQGLAATVYDYQVASALAIQTYVNNMVALGISYRPPVDLIFNNGAAQLTTTTNTIDGVTVTAGMRVLCKDSSNVGQDHLIFLASGSTNSWTWTIQQDNTGQNMPVDGHTVWVKSGTVYADQKWAFSGTQWVQIAGASLYTAGSGISISGNQISHISDDSWSHVQSGGNSGEVLTHAAANSGRKGTWAKIADANIADGAAIAWSKIANGANSNRIVTTGGASGALSTLAAGTAHQFLRSAGASMATWSSYTMPATIAVGDVNKVLAATSTSAVGLVDVTALFPVSLTAFKRVELSSANNTITVDYTQHPFSEILDVVLWRWDSATDEYRKYNVDFAVKKITLAGPITKYNVDVNSNTNWTAGSYLVVQGKKFTATDPTP